MGWSNREDNTYIACYPLTKTIILMNSFFFFKDRALDYLSTCIDQVNSFGDILQLVIVELIYKVSVFMLFAKRSPMYEILSHQVVGASSGQSNARHRAEAMLETSSLNVQVY